MTPNSQDKQPMFASTPNSGHWGCRGIFLVAVLVAIPLLIVQFVTPVYHSALRFSSSSGKKKQSSLTGYFSDNSWTVTDGIYGNTTNCAPMAWYNSTNKPVWVPSFPGSGSELFRELVQAISGLPGGSVYEKSGCHNPSATCKTHWPVLSKGVPKPYSNFHRSAIILIRNPMKAIPSWFNFIWENGNDVTHHSQQAPEDEWDQWREENFDSAIEKWKEFFITWATKSNYKVALYVAYERITSNTFGPKLLNQVGNILARANIRVEDDEAYLDCLWRRVVQEHAQRKRTEKYEPCFTRVQRGKMLEVVGELAQVFNDADMIETLSEYSRDIETKIRICR